MLEVDLAVQFNPQNLQSFADAQESCQNCTQDMEKLHDEVVQCLENVEADKDERVKGIEVDADVREIAKFLEESENTNKECVQDITACDGEIVQCVERVIVDANEISTCLEDVLVKVSQEQIMTDAL
jgi:hypothetical protein